MSITTPLSGVTLNQYFRGPAPEYRPVRIGAGDIPLAGITASIHRFYAESLQSEPGKIYVDDISVDADPEVVAALKAVLLSGVCKTKERSYACRDVFQRAFRQCILSGYGNVHLLLSSFVEEDENPFVTRIQDALKEVLSGN